MSVEEDAYKMEKMPISAQSLEVGPDDTEPSVKCIKVEFATQS